MRRHTRMVSALRGARHAFTALAVVALAGSLAAARVTAEPSGFNDEADLSVAVQFPLMLKILQFDRNLASRAGGEIVIATAFQGRYRASARARDDVYRAAQAIPGQRVADLPVRVVDIDLEQVKLKDALDRLDVDVLYITPLRATDIATITEVTRELQIASITGVRSE